MVTNLNFLTYMLMINLLLLINQLLCSVGLFLQWNPAYALTFVYAFSC